VAIAWDSDCDAIEPIKQNNGIDSAMGDSAFSQARDGLISDGSEDLNALFFERFTFLLNILYGLNEWPRNAHASRFPAS
jgi:hypothetical protein